MITPVLIVALIILGWSTAAAAMLWGMLRIARYHYRADAKARLTPCGASDAMNKPDAALNA